MAMNELFSFPAQVNEVSARLVAGFVVGLTLLYLATGNIWVLGFLAYGFVARVLTGPSLSPIGQLVTRVITPRLPVAEKIVPGPPKRFAQAIGATLSVSALILSLAGFTGISMLLVATITGAAFLESAAGYCLGCAIFAKLMAAGLIPEDTCEACNDLSRRPGFATTSS